MGKSVKYAIRVPFEDSSLFVMKNSEERATYDTYESALVAASIWKNCEIVSIEDEFDIESPDPDKRSWYYDGDGTKRAKT